MRTARGVGRGVEIKCNSAQQTVKQQKTRKTDTGNKEQTAEVTSGKGEGQREREGDKMERREAKRQDLYQRGTPCLVSTGGSKKTALVVQCACQFRQGATGYGVPGRSPATGGWSGPGFNAFDACAPAPSHADRKRVQVLELAGL